MTKPNGYLKSLLKNLKSIRERAGITTSELEERLILGPGWVTRFEDAETIPSIDMFFTILHEVGGSLQELLAGLPNYPESAEIERYVFADSEGNDLIIHFRYAKFDAIYRLPNATIGEFEEVVKTLRDGLSKLAHTTDVESAEPDISQSLKTDAVTRAFLKAVGFWPHANPSDIWWFVIYRAYCDPYNHPAYFARLDFAQSWKRTGGWALEKVVVQHYGPYLYSKGIKLFIADDVVKQKIIRELTVDERIEADKIDIVITTLEGLFLGVVNVKASLAERRTDDVPMSVALKQGGYISPLWTMDCKSMPAALPINRGELGSAEGQLSAKRMDIEVEGYFTGCFSYNQNTIPSPENLADDQRIYLCDFRNPDDAFSKFIIAKGKESLSQ